LVNWRFGYFETAPAFALRAMAGKVQKSVFNLKKPPEVLENFGGLHFYF
jgi:hypothetical protein